MSNTALAGAKLAVIVALLAMYFLHAQPLERPGPARWAQAVHAIAAVVLTMILLRELVSGRSLTLAWGVEAAAVLGAGFVFRRRLLRLTGLLIFAFCLGKLFFYDFSQLDILSRILSFIVLGCLLIAASWAYSRFREQIQKYL
jgi:uncharacterized membrane protein